MIWFTISSGSWVLNFGVGVLSVFVVSCVSGFDCSFDFVLCLLTLSFGVP